MNGSSNRGPSIAELQRYIREKTTLKFLLATGEAVIGQLRWFDENAFQLMVSGQQPFTILRSAVIGYRLYSQGDDSGMAAVARPAPSAHVQASAPNPPVAPQPAPAISDPPQSDATKATSGSDSLSADDFESQMRAMEEAEKAARKE